VNIIKRLTANDIQAAFQGCMFDLCANEGRDREQRVLRCSAYTKLTELCLGFAARNNIRDWHFNWRQSTNCRKNYNYINKDYFTK
jgi:hypothetical protein